MSDRSKFHWIKWCASPTLFISEAVKKSAPTIVKRGERVKILNKTYLSMSVVVLGMTFVLGQLLDATKSVGILSIFSVYCLSRCNEIFFAFIKDAFDKLNPQKREANGLVYYERVQMALRSYLELIINYAILFYALDVYSRQYGNGLGAFNEPFTEVLSALYFSTITIVAVGYGDFYPMIFTSRLLVCYEVMTGILLLVVSFTIYVSLSLGE
ncbi:MAG: potassium channel family protein [Cellulosilyticaceae bacterium]